MPPKKPKLDEDGVQKTILEYLEQQYRPYAINDIILNLHGAVNKAQALKALERLSRDNRITSKLLGKISIYVANQIENPLGNSGVNYNEELKEIDENISEIEKQVFELQDELKQITQKPDDIRLQADLETLTDKVSSLKKEIESTSKSKSLSLESISIIKKKELQINKECDKRFKIFKNFMKFLSEFTNPETFLDDLGLDYPTLPTI